MTASGVFYPSGADTAEERLQFYASRFPLVEVDATYYALPVRRTSELWVERTPPDFTFDIKAHALMTGQPTETKRLPKDLREALPGEVAEKARIYAKDLPDALRDDVWAWFADGLEPLQEAGQLGSILLQYPRWFFTSSENRDTIEESVGALARRRDDAGRRVPQRVVVQRQEHRADARVPRRPEDPARHGRWAAGLQVERAAPRRGDLTGARVVRFHGRRTETWEKPRASRPSSASATSTTRASWSEWVPRVQEAAGQAAADARPVQQLLRQLRRDERADARGAAPGPGLGSRGWRFRPGRRAPPSRSAGGPPSARPGPRARPCRTPGGP